MKLTILLETPTVIRDSIATVKVKLVLRDNRGHTVNGTNNRAFNPYFVAIGERFECYEKQLTAGFEISYAGCSEPVRVRACIMHWKSSRFLIPAEMGEWFGLFGNSAAFLDLVEQAYNEMQEIDPELPLWPQSVQTAPFVKSSDLNKTDEW
jgi:hypothetical protein